MPVLTRAQSARLAATNNPSDVASLASPTPDASQNTCPAENIPKDRSDVLAPKSLNAPQQQAPSPHKRLLPPLAAALPLAPLASHPLIEDTLNLSLEDEDESCTTGAEVNQPAAAVSCSAVSTTTATTTQPAAQTARRLLPEEKLLKPLPDHVMECTKLPDGPEPVIIEIEYPATEDLQGVDADAAACLTEALRGMDSPEWAAACAALLMLRRLTRHHASVCAAHLPETVPRVVKALRSLRSALCKTAIMALRDLYLTYDADELLPFTDVGGAAQPATSALAQLLLKAASNDKRFVIEEAQRALVIVAEALPPHALLSMLVPYTEHKNPKVRGKAAGVAAAAVARFSTPLDLHQFGLDSLLTVASKLITDNTPDAREAAKKIAAAAKAAFSAAEVAAIMNVCVPSPPVAATEGEEPAVRKQTPWEFYCTQVLGPTKAGAVLRAAV